MWMGERSAGVRQSYESSVDRGVVTQNQETTGVYLEGERREISVYAPGGYAWVPSIGQEVLVLKESLGEQQVVATPAKVAGLSAGDVAIYTEGGGKIVLSGNRVAISGTVEINGQSLEDYIRQVMSGG